MRGLWAGGLGLLMAACTGGAPAAVTVGKHLGSGSEAELARYVNHRPMEVRHGRASYYSDSLAGNRTANGEVYRPEHLTAASRDLPFGTIVRVVRPATGHWVIVRINDRGPFGDERRILDLSRAAARHLDMLRRGVVRIRAEVLERGR